MADSVFATGNDVWKLGSADREDERIWFELSFFLYGRKMLSAKLFKSKEIGRQMISDTFTIATKWTKPKAKD